jgi:hypothetical protein
MTGCDPKADIGCMEIVVDDQRRAHPAPAEQRAPLKPHHG